MSSKNILIKIQRVVPCHKCYEFAQAGVADCEVCHGETLEFLDDTISAHELLMLILEEIKKA